MARMMFNSGRRKRLTALAAVLAASSIGTACGSDESSSGDAKGSAAEAKTPYVIGNVTSQTGPLASSVGPFGSVIEAWVKYTNDNGGIDGHPIKVVTVDDGADPAKSLSGIKKAVEQEHAIALFGGSGAATAWDSYVKQRKIPVIGGFGSNPLYDTNPYFFSNAAPPNVTFRSAVFVLKKLGATKIATMWCTESPVCKVGADGAKDAANGEFGLKAVYGTGIASAAPDYTAPCLAAKKAGADGMYVSAAASTQLNVATACAKQDYRPLLVTSGPNFNQTWLKVPAAEGAAASVGNFPFTEKTDPGVAKFYAALQKYAPERLTADTFGGIDTYAWTTGELFKKAAEAAKMGDKPTSEGLLKGLYSLKDETLGGLAPPLTYTEDPVSPNKANACFFWMQIKQSEFTAPEGMKTSCVPPKG